MKKGKYIVGEILTGHQLPVFGALIFPEAVPHGFMISCFEAGSIVGAGFVNISSVNGTNIHVYGESKDLNINSRPEDEKVIRKTLGIT